MDIDTEWQFAAVGIQLATLRHLARHHETLEELATAINAMGELDLRECLLGAVVLLAMESQ